MAGCLIDCFSLTVWMPACLPRCLPTCLPACLIDCYSLTAWQSACLPVPLIVIHLLSAYLSDCLTLDWIQPVGEAGLNLYSLPAFLPHWSLFLNCLTVCLAASLIVIPLLCDCLHACLIYCYSFTVWLPGCLPNTGLDTTSWWSGAKHIQQPV